MFFLPVYSQTPAILLLSLLHVLLSSLPPLSSSFFDKTGIITPNLRRWTTQTEFPLRISSAGTDKVCMRLYDDQSAQLGCLLGYFVVFLTNFTAKILSEKGKCGFFSPLNVRLKGTKV